MSHTDASLHGVGGTSAAAHERVRRVRETAPLGHDTAWVVVAAAPLGPAPPDAPKPDPLAELVRREVATWPAAIPLASGPSEVFDGRIVYAPPIRSDALGARYRAEFHPDGSALVALALGVHRESHSDGTPVWTVGEGAVAWIVVAALRLAAAYADRSGARNLWAEAVVVAPADAPIEIWNHDRHAYGPAGRRLAEPQPSARAVATAACLSAGLLSAARPLVVGVLRPFGLTGDRHIDPAGVLRRDGFTGFGDRILAWAEKIGVPSRP